MEKEVAGRIFISADNAADTVADSCLVKSEK